jgi:hypothetical protein
MMKKGIALTVMIVLAGQSLFCVDLRLDGNKAAVFNEARESARLNLSIARLAPLAELPPPPAPIVEQPITLPSQDSSDGLVWLGVTGLLLLLVGASVGTPSLIIGIVDGSDVTTGIGLGGLGLAALGGVFLVLSL